MPDPRTTDGELILDVKPCPACGLVFRVGQDMRSDTNGAGWVHQTCFWELVRRGLIPAPPTLRKKNA